MMWYKRILLRWRCMLPWTGKMGRGWANVMCYTSHANNDLSITTFIGWYKIYTEIKISISFSSGIQVIIYKYKSSTISKRLWYPDKLKRQSTITTENYKVIQVSSTTANKLHESPHRTLTNTNVSDELSGRRNHNTNNNTINIQSGKWYPEREKLELK